MNASTIRPSFVGTPGPWDVITEDLLIIARDPFHGELSALRKSDEGVVIADLKASLPAANRGLQVPLLNAAVRSELRGNARLIRGAHDLLSTCIQVQSLITTGDFYGAARQRVLQLLHAAIMDAVTRPVPVLDRFEEVAQ